MGHEIRFQKAGSGLIPLLECTDRNLLLQQRSRSCGGEAALTQFALRTQEAIRCRCAHGKQLASALLCDLEMLMPLQITEECGEKGDEPFGADPVGCMPDKEQRVLDFRSIPAKVWTLKCVVYLLCMVEEPHCVFTHIASGCYKDIKQRPFV